MHQFSISINCAYAIFDSKLFAWIPETENIYYDSFDFISSNPIQFDNLGSKKVSKIYCNTQICHIITEEGQVYSWGNDREKYGILAMGDNYYISSPILNSNFIGKRIIDLSISEKHGAAIDELHQLYTWGYSPYGECGYINTNNKSNIPNAVSHKNIYPLQIKCGYTYTLILDYDNTVYYYGVICDKETLREYSSKLNTVTKHQIPIDKTWNIRVDKIFCGSKLIGLIDMNHKMYLYSDYEGLYLVKLKKSIQSIKFVYNNIYAGVKNDDCLYEFSPYKNAFSIEDYSEQLYNVDNMIGNVNVIDTPYYDHVLFCSLECDWDYTKNVVHNKQNLFKIVKYNFYTNEYEHPSKVNTIVNNRNSYRDKRITYNSRSIGCNGVNSINKNGKCSIINNANSFPLRGGDYSLNIGEVNISNSNNRTSNRINRIGSLLGKLFDKKIENINSHNTLYLGYNKKRIDLQLLVKGWHIPKRKYTAYGGNVDNSNNIKTKTLHQRSSSCLNVYETKGSNKFNIGTTKQLRSISNEKRLVDCNNNNVTNKDEESKNNLNKKKEEKKEEKKPPREYIKMDNIIGKSNKNNKTLTHSNSTNNFNLRSMEILNNLNNNLTNHNTNDPMINSADNFYNKNKKNELTISQHNNNNNNNYRYTQQVPILLKKECLKLNEHPKMLSQTNNTRDYDISLYHNTYNVNEYIPNETSELNEALHYNIPKKPTKPQLKPNNTTSSLSFPKFSHLDSITPSQNINLSIVNTETEKLFTFDTPNPSNNSILNQPLHARILKSSLNTVISQCNHFMKTQLRKKHSHNILLPNNETETEHSFLSKQEHSNLPENPIQLTSSSNCTKETNIPSFSIIKHKELMILSDKHLHDGINKRHTTSPQIKRYYEDNKNNNYYEDDEDEVLYDYTPNKKEFTEYKKYYTHHKKSGSMNTFNTSNSINNNNINSEIYNNMLHKKDNLSKFLSNTERPKTGIPCLYSNSNINCISSCNNINSNNSMLNNMHTQTPIKVISSSMSSFTRTPFTNVTVTRPQMVTQKKKNQTQKKYIEKIKNKSQIEQQHQRYYNNSSISSSNNNTNTSNQIHPLLKRQHSSQDITSNKRYLHSISNNNINKLHNQYVGYFSKVCGDSHNQIISELLNGNDNDNKHNDINCEFVIPQIDNNKKKANGVECGCGTEKERKSFSEIKDDLKRYVINNKGKYVNGKHHEVVNRNDTDVNYLISLGCSVNSSFVGEPLELERTLCQNLDTYQSGKG